MNANRNRTFALVAGLALLAPFASAVRSADDAGGSNGMSNGITVTGFTKPSEERKLAFGAPGLVADVAVKEGDVVKKGQLLARQDSRQDEDTLKSAEREASSTDKIEYSKADLKSKSVVYKRKQELFNNGRAASQSELEDAELAVSLAAAQIKLAEIEHDQKGWDADKERDKIDQMHITSPLDGIVEKINIGAGEMADPQSRDGAIVVGQWDPLWLEMHLPSAQASQLKMGQELPARYDGDDWQKAKIIFFEKVDAASDTEMVRLELPNPGDMKLPGLHMQIKLQGVIAVAANDGH